MATVVGFVFTFRNMRRMGASFRFAFKMARFAAQRGVVFEEAY